MKITRGESRAPATRRDGQEAARISREVMERRMRDHVAAVARECARLRIRIVPYAWGFHLVGERVNVRVQTLTAVRLEDLQR